MKGNNPNLDLVNNNAHTKFGEILSIHSQDIERKRKSDIYNSRAIPLFQNLRKKTNTDPSLYLVNINAHTKFGEIQSICFQDY